MGNSDEQLWGIPASGVTESDDEPRQHNNDAGDLRWCPHCSRVGQHDTAPRRDLEQRGYAPATISKAYQIVSRAFRVAVTDGIITRSPCREVKLPKIEMFCV